MVWKMERGNRQEADAKRNSKRKKRERDLTSLGATRTAVNSQAKSSNDKKRLNPQRGIRWGQAKKPGPQTNFKNKKDGGNKGEQKEKNVHKEQEVQINKKYIERMRSISRKIEIALKLPRYGVGHLTQGVCEMGERSRERGINELKDLAKE